MTMHWVNTFLLLILCVLFSHRQCEACKEPFFLYQASCYFIQNITATFAGNTHSDARAICKSYGGDLAFLDSRTVNYTSLHKITILHIILHTFVSHTQQDYWVGLEEKSGNKTDCYKITSTFALKRSNCQLLNGFVCMRDVGAVVPTKPAVPLIPPVSLSPIRCELGWLKWGGSCYKLVTGSKRQWNDARDSCERLSSDLVVINNEKEQIFLTNLLQEHSGGFWIGLSDKSVEGKFIWVDGLPVNFTSWQSSEPNNGYGQEDCVSMHAGSVFTGHWFDDNCQRIQNYICERSSATPLCPADWIPHGDYCYQINVHPIQRKTWSGALLSCRTNKANLVSFSSEEEERMIFNEIKNAVEDEEEMFYWLGLRQQNNRWVWSDGSHNLYQNWFDNENGTDIVLKSCAKSSLSGFHGNWMPASSCLEKHSFVCKLHRSDSLSCNMPLGMQSYKILDAAITSNSQLRNSTPALAARLYQQPETRLDGAWCSEKTLCNTRKSYLQINLEGLSKVTHIGIQGKANSDAVVTQFMLMYSLDGKSWDPYKSWFRFQLNSSFHIVRNSSRDKVDYLPLIDPITAKLVRIYPTAYHVDCCLRVEVFGCSVQEKNSKCGVGWQEEPKTGNCYWISEEQTTWDDAQSYCSNHASHLLSISSYKDGAFLNNLLRWKRNDYWVGLNDLDKKGIFKWADGSPLKFVNWADSNPKIDSKVGYRRDYRDCWHRCKWKSGLCLSFCGKKGYCCRKGYTGCPSELMGKATANYHTCIAAPSKLHGQCVSIRKYKSTWMWETHGCTSRRSFICQRTQTRSGVRTFSTNWKTNADFYWPLDVVAGQQVFGTVEGIAVGYFPKQEVQVGSQERDVLHFRNFKEFVALPVKELCARDPLASLCVNGFSLSFLFLYDGKSSVTTFHILDTMGDQLTAKGLPRGYRVSVKLGRLVFKLSGTIKTYEVNVDFEKGKWNHYMFTWKPLKGLSVYLNGKKTKARVQITSTRKSTFSTSSIREVRNPTNNKTVFLMDPPRLFVSNYHRRMTVNMTFTSLAIYKRELTDKEVKHIFLSEYGQCEKGHFTHGSYCYKVNTIPRRPKEAASHCRRESGYLMSIHSPIEQAWLNNIVSTYKLSRGVYIGLNDELKNKYDFSSWADGTPLSYTYWGPYMPKKKKSNSRSRRSPWFWFLDGRHPWRRSRWGYRRRPIWNIVRSTRQIYATSDGHWMDPQLSRQSHRPYVCKFEKTLSVLPQTNSSARHDSVCGIGYTRFNNNTCYKLYLEEKSALDARRVCQEEGADLVNIHSRQQEMMLASMMVRLYKRSNVWIGVRYNSTSQTYTGLNGGSINYTNWYNGYPDPQDGEFVSVSANHHGSDKILFWKVAQGTEKLPFFCSKTTSIDSTPSPVITGTRCPSEWAQYGSNCYRILEDKLEHMEASSVCSRMLKNADLASIETSQENDFIFQLLQNRTQPLFTNAWIGLTNEALVKGYNWRDGKPLQYINWYTNNPYSGSRHLCVGMNRGGKWWDVECDRKHISVCKGVPPEHMPTSAAPATTPKRQHPDDVTAHSSFNIRTSFDIKKEQLLTTFDVVRKEFSVSFEVFVTNNTKRRVYSESVFRMTAHKSRTGTSSRIPMVLMHPQGKLHIGYGIRYIHNTVSLNVWHKVVVKQEKNIHGKYQQQIIVNEKVLRNVSYLSAIEYRDVSVYLGDPWTAPYNSKIRNINITGICCLLTATKGQLVLNNTRGMKTKQPKSFMLKYLSQQFSSRFDVNPIASSDSNNDSVIYFGKNKTFVKQPINAKLGRKQSNFEKRLCIATDYTQTHCIVADNFWATIEISQLQYVHTYIIQVLVNKTIQMEVTNPVPENQYNVSLSFENLSVRNIVVKNFVICETGWVTVNDSCYYLSTEAADYITARTKCEDMSAHLTSIFDAAENKKVTDLVNSQGIWRPASAVTYIGLDDRTHEGGWQWMDKSPVTFVNWAENNPDDAFGGEDCVGVRRDGFWVDVPCNDHNKFICKKRKDGTRVATGEDSSVNIDKSVGICDAGWIRYKLKCYLFMLSRNDTKAFKDALKGCRVEGGNLVSIHNTYENAFIVSHLTPHADTVWIGLTDARVEKRFLWTDQSRVEYTNWGLKEPNNMGNEDCTHLIGQSSLGKWNDLKCDTRLPYVCEKAVNTTQSSIPTPPSPEDNEPCPKGYQKFKGNCYKVVVEPLSWNDALSYCRKQKKGDLVSVSSPYIQAFIVAQTANTNSTNWWIGLHRQSTDKEMSWSDHSQLLHEYWKNGRQPSTGNNTSLCVSVHTNVTHIERSWASSECSQKLPFVCQVVHKPVDPLPTFLGNCTKGWTRIGSMCYKMFTKDPVGWVEAQVKCESEHADLATVINKELQNHFTTGARYHKKSFWIGLNDRDEEGVFRWVSGSSSPYTNWNPREPNQYQGKPENCAVMNPNGGWNDITCTYKFSYICEHSLWCRDPLGMQDGRIPDKAINATSHVDSHVAVHARFKFINNMSFSDGWCFNKSYDQTPALTIHLGDLTTITRIKTVNPNLHDSMSRLIGSYTLDYSEDGENWFSYTEGNVVRTFTNAGSNAQELLVRTRYLRYKPVVDTVQKEVVCVQMELYGCKAKCSRPLGMSTYGIREDQLSASSNLGYLSNARPPHGEGWCGTNKDTQPWFQIRLHHVMKITRTLVMGNIDNFTLSFGLAQKDMRPYCGYENSVRIFEMDSTVHEAIHELENPPSAQIVRYHLTKGNKHACIKVELFGCEMTCDDALGMESGVIGNSDITASSEAPSYPSQYGRLNNRGWCAKQTDQFQYIQVKLPGKAKITHLATQGVGASYVKEYLLQWSQDGDLFIQLDHALNGNTNGNDIMKTKLREPLGATFIRIIPTSVHLSPCLRVEVYGCLITELYPNPPDTDPIVTAAPFKADMSEGGKIGLLVFFLILIIVIVVMGSMYYRKKSKEFPKSSFYSVSVKEDEINIIGAENDDDEAL